MDSKYATVQREAIQDTPTRSGFEPRSDSAGLVTREKLLHALYEAAELEHNLMCTYLYAAVSLRDGVAEGLSQSKRWPWRAGGEPFSRWQSARWDTSYRFGISRPRSVVHPGSVGGISR